MIEAAVTAANDELADIDPAVVKQHGARFLEVSRLQSINSNGRSGTTQNDTKNDNEEINKKDYRPMNSAARQCATEYKKQFSLWKKSGKIGRKPAVKDVVEALATSGEFSIDDTLKRLQKNPNEWKEKRQTKRQTK